MTTDELLTKLPSHIGRNKFNGFYISDNKRGGYIGWLYLHNDGKDWCASYGREGNFVCLNPDAEKPPYNNAVAYGKTPNEALQGLYEWCVKNGFINQCEEKKKQEYPKTFEECCKILGVLNVDLCFNADYRSFDDSKEQWKRLGLMNQFYKLHICRDAYWKIAGEEMGLGKPWEPDWTTDDVKHSLVNVGNTIIPSVECKVSRILAFPTKEMRDAFYENFKEEIEICKELL